MKNGLEKKENLTEIEKIGGGKRKREDEMTGFENRRKESKKEDGGREDGEKK